MLVLSSSEEGEDDDSTYISKSLSRNWKRSLKEERKRGITESLPRISEEFFPFFPSRCPDFPSCSIYCVEIKLFSIELYIRLVTFLYIAFGKRKSVRRKIKT